MLNAFLWEKGSGVLKEAKTLEELINFNRYFPPYEVPMEKYRITIIYGKEFINCYNYIHKEVISVSELDEKVRELESILIEEA